MLINVLFCVDGNFWQHLGVSIASLLISNPHHHFRIIVASTSEIDQKWIGEIQEFLRSHQNATLETTPCLEASQYLHLPVHSHLSFATYLRLFMTGYLDPSIDKIIYLDSDVVVCEDIGDLWTIDLGDAYLGAAPEPYDRNQRQHLGFSPKDLYINAGVMLVNVAKWRADDVQPQLMEFADANQDKLVNHDQDILNCVFRGRIVNIGFEWNWQSLFPRFKPSELNMSYEEWNRLRRKPRLVHFISRYKPWYYRWAPHYKQLYYRVLAQTPWAGYIPPDKSLRNLPVKLIKLAQRWLEWYVPSFARILRKRRLEA